MSITKCFKLALFAVPMAFTNAIERSMMSATIVVDLIVEIGTDVTVNGRFVDFKYDDVSMGLIYDTMADRMQIHAPITHVSTLNDGQLVEMMEANFHTTLDVRYAVDEGKVYAAFFHPLTDLSENFLRDVLKQVASAKNTFGSKYSAGSWVFSGHSNIDLDELDIETNNSEDNFGVDNDRDDIDETEETEIDNFVQPDENAEDIKD
mmetsp:Transcript_16590/g.22737  ORF Transcript_16590/g.22737 Transcript_16590/m.22737 type:complete len:206 (-) Transcript_16590:190-807(-)|eukprot:CAMPEP_0185725404 /NCGR_PEP_ID=MMETSP1171-20130828/1664_1 /TAXON_ID=374046 /ORGANISM="Helicotheca tamensis, Strain CCMP826" /LENGTH=205 /DNA_ID=CAMNT_0028393527 /DNA_START=214 /DNA_END=831 /DNA_ORIENTATION=-